MNSHRIFCAWTLQTFFISMGLIVPKEIIIFIVSLCKISIKIVNENGFFLSATGRMNRTDAEKAFKENIIIISRNNHAKIFGTVSKDDEKIDIHMKRIFKQESILEQLMTLVILESYMYENLNRVFTEINIPRIKKIIKIKNGRIILSTKCKKIICYNFRDAYITAACFSKFKKIMTNDSSIYVKESGESFYFKIKETDEKEITTSEVNIFIKNIVKFVETPMRIIFINDVGNVFMRKYTHMYDTKHTSQIAVSTIINIYHSFDDYYYWHEFFIFLSAKGEIYSAGVYHRHILGLTERNDVSIREPKKINLQNVAAVNVKLTYVLALTFNDDLYMWGNIADCQTVLGVPIIYNGQKRRRMSTPVLICRIKYDFVWCNKLQFQNDGTSSSKESRDNTQSIIEDIKSSQS